MKREIEDLTFENNLVKNEISRLESFLKDAEKRQIRNEKIIRNYRRREEKDNSNPESLSLDTDNRVPEYTNKMMQVDGIGKSKSR